MIEQEIIEHNQRQIALMESKIKLYRNNQISIKDFIDDIDALSGWIQNPPADWVRSIKSLWWEIENIYAWALHKEKDLTDEELQEISGFVDKIEELVIWYKNNFISQNFLND